MLLGVTIKPIIVLRGQQKVIISELIILLVESPCPKNLSRR